MINSMYPKLMITKIGIPNTRHSRISFEYFSFLRRISILFLYKFDYVVKDSLPY
nr:MAG TPA: hypothetical protein [Caudoviricetes sp.]